MAAQQQLQQQQRQVRPVRLLYWADNDVTKDSFSVLQAMMKVKYVSTYLFGGDGPYKKFGTEWTKLMGKFFNTKELMDRLILNMGNHDTKSSESIQTQRDIEKWYGRGLAESKWLHARQVGNVYIISMNTEDLDIKWKRSQYKWVESQLQRAAQLRQKGIIDWIVVAFHKPFFTLKSSHSPYTDVRRLYIPLFIKYGVDICLQGHNHNTQFWFPMDVDFSVEDNGLGKQLYTLLSRKPYVFDFSKRHGPAFVVSGHGGHEWNEIADDGDGVKNVMFYGDGTTGMNEFGYTQIDFRGKEAIIGAVGVSGKVYYYYKLSRVGLGRGVGQTLQQVPIPTQQQKPVGNPPPKIYTPQAQKTQTGSSGGTGKAKLVWSSAWTWPKKDRQFDSQDPLDPKMEMRAGDGRLMVIKGGVGYQSGARGRQYIYANNYNARMTVVYVHNTTLDNFSLRLRSRHNEGGNGNDFGGCFFVVHRDHVEVGYEVQHSPMEHRDLKKFTIPALPTNQPVKVDWMVYDVKGQSGKPAIQFVGYIYYPNNPTKAHKVGPFTDPNPPAKALDKASFKQKSYAFVRTNNENGMPKNIKILKQEIWDATVW